MAGLDWEATYIEAVKETSADDSFIRQTVAHVRPHRTAFLAVRPFIPQAVRIEPTAAAAHCLAVGSEWGEAST